MIIVYLDEVGKDEFEMGGGPMYMPLKLKLQDSGQFYHKMSWYSIKVLTVIFITQFRWESLILRPRKFSYLKKASPFSPSIVSTLGLHLYSLQQMEEKEHISIYVEEVKEMRRTTNQLFGNWCTRVNIIHFQRSSQSWQKTSINLLHFLRAGALFLIP